MFNVGFETTVPPVEASYQTTRCPAVAVIASLAFNVWIGFSSHSVISPVLIGAAGASVIVRATDVLVALGHPPASVLASA